jgi:hypothetical protein
MPDTNLSRNKVNNENIIKGERERERERERENKLFVVAVVLLFRVGIECIPPE